MTGEPGKPSKHGRAACFLKPSRSLAILRLIRCLNPAADPRTKGQAVPPSWCSGVTWVLLSETLEEGFRPGLCFQIWKYDRKDGLTWANKLFLGFFFPWVSKEIKFVLGSAWAQQCWRLINISLSFTGCVHGRNEDEPVTDMGAIWGCFCNSLVFNTFDVSTPFPSHSTVHNDLLREAFQPYDCVASLGTALLVWWSYFGFPPKHKSQGTISQVFTRCNAGFRSRRAYTWITAPSLSSTYLAFREVSCLIPH